MTGIKRKTNTPDTTQDAVLTPTKRSKRIQEANDAKLKVEQDQKTDTTPSPKQKKVRKKNKKAKEKKGPTLDFYIEKAQKPKEVEQKDAQHKDKKVKVKVKGLEKEELQNGKEGDIDNIVQDEKKGDSQASSAAPTATHNSLNGHATPEQPKKIHPFFETPSQKQQRLKEEQLQKEKLRKEQDKQLTKKDGVPTASIFLTAEQKRKLAQEKHLQALREEIRERAEEDRALAQGKDPHPFLLPKEPGSCTDVSPHHAPSPFPLLCGAFIPDFPSTPHVRQLLESAGIIHSPSYKYYVKPPSPTVPLVPPTQHAKLIPSYDKLYTLARKDPKTVHKKGDTDLTSVAVKDCLNTIREQCECGNSDSPVDPLMQELEWCKAKCNANNVVSTENPLWTEKYKPDGVNNIIGNENSVASLAVWLNQWKEKEQRRWTKFIKTSEDNKGGKEKGKGRKPKREGKGEKLQNVLLVVGPSGSGKTGAISAAAKQYLFEILEVNSSTRRTSKLLTEVFGEATQSHQVGKNFTTAANSTLIHTLMVIEEIDTIQEESKSFFNTLEELINTSKRPFILTCNEITPPIQQLLTNPNTRKLSFTTPPPALLTRTLCCIGLAEGSSVIPKDILQLVNWSKCDIRQSILSFQFWVQHKQLAKGHAKDVRPNSKLQLYREADVFERFLGLGDLMSMARQGGLLFTHKLLNEEEVILLEHAHTLGLNILFENYLKFERIFSIMKPKLPPAKTSKTKSESSTDERSRSKVASEIIEAAASVIHDLSSVDILRTLHTLDEGCEQFSKFSPTYEGMWSYMDNLDEVLPVTLSAMSYSRVCNIVEEHEEYMDRQEDEGYSALSPPKTSNLDGLESVQRISSRIVLGNGGAGIPTHRSARLDYQPALHSILLAEEVRRSLNPKRGGRFAHYLSPAFSECDIADVKALVLSGVTGMCIESTETAEM